jgi:integrase
MIALPDRKGGARRPHPVGSNALAILASLPRVANSPWVLSAPRDTMDHLSTSVVENHWQRIRARAGLDDVHIHDLRHTVATYGSQAGSNAFGLRDLLRHATTAMTGRYVNRDADPIRAMSEAIGARIAEGLGATAGVTRAEPRTLDRSS